MPSQFAQAAITKYYRRGSLMIETYFSQFWRLRSSRSRCQSSKDPHPGLQKATFLLYSYTMEREGEYEGWGGGKKRMRGMERVGGITFPSSASRAIIQSD